MSSMITETSSPFPIKSSMYFQQNCMMSMNMEMKKVTTKGPANERILKRVNFFTRYKVKKLFEVAMRLESLELRVKTFKTK